MGGWWREPWFVAPPISKNGVRISNMVVFKVSTDYFMQVWEEVHVTGSLKWAKLVSSHYCYFPFSSPSFQGRGMEYIRSRERAAKEQSFTQSFSSQFPLWNCMFVTMDQHQFILSTSLFSATQDSKNHFGNKTKPTIFFQATDKNVRKTWFVINVTLSLIRKTRKIQLPWILKKL